MFATRTALWTNAKLDEMKFHLIVAAHVASTEPRHAVSIQAGELSSEFNKVQV